MTGLLDALFNGLSLSSILILAALGLGVTFGVMRVINMAHGEMMMLGAYLGYILTDPYGLSVLVSGLGHLAHETAKIVGVNWEPKWQTEVQLELNLFFPLFSW
jgi:branched-subunit amino acid ABC-type transport system permease component